jgi:flagellar protein FliO/FliZ
MPRPRASLRAALGLPLWLTIGAVVLDTAPAHADAPATTEASNPGNPSALKGLIHRSRAPRRESLDSSWWGMVGITFALAVCGGTYAICRRFLPQSAAGAICVVSRVSLSPKHSVYMLRIGRRVLLVGTGPQGAPSLIAELEDLPGVEPNPGQVQGGEP